MKKIQMYAFILSLLILLTSCSSQYKLQQTETKQTEQTTKDAFSMLRNSDETWIYYGLKAYEEKVEPQDVSAFFKNSEGMSYLTLYETVFVTNPDKAIAVSEDFFRYVVENYGADEILNKEKRVEYKSEYLKTIGLKYTYPQPKEAETLLSSMVLTKTNDKDFPFKITLDSCSYYFKDLMPNGSISPTHGFLYYNTKGLNTLIKTLEEMGINKYLDKYEGFEYYMTFSNSPLSKTDFQTGKMHINDFSAALHESLHAMGIKSKENLWLSEGICEYFGKALGFQQQTDAAYIQILSMAGKGAYNELAQNGNKSALRYIKTAEIYKNKGGKYDSLESFDPLLFMDSFAKAEMELNFYSTIQEAYTVGGNDQTKYIGGDMSYSQAGSLVAHLINTYGLEKVFSAYETQDIIGCFEKDQNTLKNEWISTL